MQNFEKSSIQDKETEKITKHYVYLILHIETNLNMNKNLFELIF